MAIRVRVVELRTEMTAIEQIIRAAAFLLGGVGLWLFAASHLSWAAYRGVAGDKKRDRRQSFTFGSWAASWASVFVIGRILGGSTRAEPSSLQIAGAALVLAAAISVTFLSFRVYRNGAVGSDRSLSKGSKVWLVVSVGIILTGLFANAISP